MIQDFFEVGRSYTLADFLDQCRKGLHAASARVASVYGGSGCSRAMAQLAAIEAKAEREADKGRPGAHRRFRDVIRSTRHGG